MTPASLQRLMGAIAAPIREALLVRDASIKALTSRVAALEEKVEAQKGLEYFGVWDASTEYTRNAAVTSSGSLWILRSERSKGVAPPGGGWQLACKRGADGKDLR